MGGICTCGSATLCPRTIVQPSRLLLFAALFTAGTLAARPARDARTGHNVAKRDDQTVDLDGGITQSITATGKLIQWARHNTAESSKPEGNVASVDMRNDNTETGGGMGFEKVELATNANSSLMSRETEEHNLLDRANASRDPFMQNLVAMHEKAQARKKVDDVEIHRLEVEIKYEDTELFAIDKELKTVNNDRQAASDVNMNGLKGASEAASEVASKIPSEPKDPKPRNNGNNQPKLPTQPKEDPDWFTDADIDEGMEEARINPIHSSVVRGGPGKIFDKLKERYKIEGAGPFNEDHFRLTLDWKVQEDLDLLLEFPQNEGSKKGGKVDVIFWKTKEKGPFSLNLDERADQKRDAYLEDITCQPGGGKPAGMYIVYAGYYLDKQADLKRHASSVDFTLYFFPKKFYNLEFNGKIGPRKIIPIINFTIGTNGQDVDKINKIGAEVEATSLQNFYDKINH